jgi:hypothetical protein
MCCYYCMHMQMRIYGSQLFLFHIYTQYTINIACMHAAKVAGTWLKSVRALVLQLVTPLHTHHGTA